MDLNFLLRNHDNQLKKCINLSTFLYLNISAMLADAIELGLW